MTILLYSHITSVFQYLIKIKPYLIIHQTFQVFNFKSLKTTKKAWMQTEWDTKRQQNGQILYLDTCLHYMIYHYMAPQLHWHQVCFGVPALQFWGACTAVLRCLHCSFEVPALQFRDVCIAVWFSFFFISPSKSSTDSGNLLTKMMYLNKNFQISMSKHLLVVTW